MAVNRVRIAWPAGEVFALLDATPTSAVLCAVLPIESAANTWDEEVYFAVALNVKREADARQVVDPGTICFWVEGSSLALPFGPTPISRGNECRLITKVNVIGRFEGDAQLLGSVADGDKIRVESAD